MIRCPYCGGVYCGSVEPEKWAVERRQYAEHSNDVAIHDYLAPAAVALPNGPERRQSQTRPGRMTFTTMREN